MMSSCSMKTHSLLFSALLFLIPISGTAQIPDHLSDNAHISLLTILPGDALYSAFGHSAVRVHDPDAGMDIVFNYGTFDFSDPMFIPRFIYGRLDYFLSVSRFAPNFEASKAEGRPIIEQTLRLSSTQAQAVYERLLLNARRENRIYRYDFLFDNCSTRPRDILEASLGEAIRFNSIPDPHLSFRRLLDPYVADRPLIDFGFDLGLGHTTDRIATQRELVFLPDYLFAAMAHADIDSAGVYVPLVAYTDTLLWIPGYHSAQAGPPWMTLVFGLMLIVALAGSFVKRARPTHRYRGDLWLFGVTGFVGLFLLFMWFGTEHHVTRDNWNILWALPSHIIVAYVFWRGKVRAWHFWYFVFSTLLIVVAATGYLTDWPQTYHPAMLPWMALLAWRSIHLARQLKSESPVGKMNAGA